MKTVKTFCYIIWYFVIGQTHATEYIDSMFVNLYTGEESYTQGALLLKPIYGSFADTTTLDEQPADSATFDWSKLKYTFSLWLQYDSLGNYTVNYRIPTIEQQVIDMREMYLRFEGDTVWVSAGKFLCDVGYNTIVNPADFLPLDYYDPIHPNRMGLWGLRLDYKGVLHAASFVNQGSLGVENGPWRTLPQTVDIADHNYDQDIGFALWLDGEEDWFRYGLIYYNGVNDLAQLSPNSEGDVSLNFSQAKTYSAALELLFDTITIRNEITYKDLEEEESYGWGILELSRLFTVGEWDNALNITGYLAYETSNQTFYSYDRLRKQAAGIHLVFDLLSDGSLKFNQEIAVGTKEDDFYSKTSLTYQLSSSIWLDCNYQIARVDDAQKNQVQLVGLTLSKWF